MITLIQTETTYEVRYKSKSFQVVVLEDKLTLGYTDYSVFDVYGNHPPEKTELEVISYLEENIG